AADDEAVDADLAQLVDDHGDELARPLLEEPAQQGRLAAAEESADDVDRDGRPVRHPPERRTGSPSSSAWSPPRWARTEAPTSSRRTRAGRPLPRATHTASVKVCMPVRLDRPKTEGAP